MVRNTSHTSCNVTVIGKELLSRLPSKSNGGGGGGYQGLFSVCGLVPKRNPATCAKRGKTFPSVTGVRRGKTLMM